MKVKRRIAITGIGLISPLGIGVKESWDNLIAGKSGVGQITLFDASNYETQIACEVKGFNPADFMLPEIFRKTDRFSQFGVAAARMAIEDSGIIIHSENHVPVFIGSGLGGSLFHEEQIFKLMENKDPRKVLSSSVPRIAPNAVSAYIAMQFQLKGPNLTISTACSSGGNAIALAGQAIQSGIADVVLTGGVECPISPFTYAAYQSLRVLAKQNGLPVPRPFDKKRDGFVLGEAAGMLVLEEFNRAKERGAKIYGELKGWASNCGAYHMAAPEPSGDDAALAIKDALSFAELIPNDIDHINAHGTATQLNDLSEAKAITKIFNSKIPYVTSTKSATGHTIGAAGAIEAIFTLLAIKEGVIPPTINCDLLDENCNINVVQNHLLKRAIRFAISNSFGFGSNNSVLVFGKA